MKRIILCAVLILSIILVGCKNEGNKKNVAESEAIKQTETANKDEAYREVVDQAGRTVKVPKDPKRVVITFWPMGSAYTLFQLSLIHI